MEITDTINIDTSQPAAEIAARIISYYDAFITWGEGIYAAPNDYGVRCCALGVLANALYPGFWEEGAATQALRRLLIDGQPSPGTDFSVGLFHGNDNKPLDEIRTLTLSRRVSAEHELGYQVGQLVRRWALEGIDPHE